MDKLIINFTPTGMIPTKKQTPHVPVTPEEIIEDVRIACSLGITMVHLHARDENQAPHYSKDIYRKIISGIRKFAPELIICVSTSGRIYEKLEYRSEILMLDGDEKPDMASLALSSLNFNKQASINSPETIAGLAQTMKDRGIAPELEAFDSGMLNYAKYLIKKGLLNPPHYVNFILGNIACAQANLLSAGLMENEVPDNSVISFGAIGDKQLRIISLAISMGFGVRVGLEDNIWYDKERTKLASNAMLIERTLTIAQANQREVMKPSELRNILGLKNGNGNYGLKQS